MPREATSRSRSARSRKKRPVSTASATRSELFSVQDRRHHHKVLQETQQRRARLLPLAAQDVALRQHMYRDEVHTILDEGALEVRAKERENRLAHSQVHTSTGKVPTSSLRVQFRESCAGKDADADDPSSLGHVDSTVALAVTAAVSPPSLVSLLRAAADKRYTQANTVSSSSDLTVQADPVADAVPATKQTAVSSGSHTESRGTGTDRKEEEDVGAWLDQEENSEKEMDYEAWLAAGCPTGCWKDLLENELYGPERAEKAYYALKYQPEHV